MFCHCYSLYSLPDIVKWDISNVSKMNNILYGCTSLYPKPNLSKWNLDKVEEKENLV